MTTRNTRFAPNSCPERLGVLLDYGDAQVLGFDPGTTWEPQSGRNFTLNPAPYTALPSDPGGRSNAIHFDAVHDATTDRHFLIVTTSFFVARFEILANDVTHLATSWCSYPPINTSTMNRTPKGEAEAIVTNGVIRFAFTTAFEGMSTTFPPTPVVQFRSVCVLTFDPSTADLAMIGDIQYDLVDYTGSSDAVNVQNDPVVNYRVSGLEFSPNGEYLYWWLPPVTNGPAALGYIDLAYETMNGLVASAPEFVDSELELGTAPNGTDAMLYMVGRDASGNARLGGLLGPDDPSTATWVSNVEPLGQVALNDPLGINGDLYYLMNSQPANDPNQPMLESFQCCDEVFIMTAIPGYTAPTGTSVWTATTNPFGDRPEVRLSCTLRIPTGAHVTATGMTFRFSDLVKVIIEPGASFRCDDCLFTGACNSRWKGIEVWGTNTQPQTGVYPQYQGKLDLRNSTIENAAIGVLVGRQLQSIWSLPMPWLGYSGGVLEARESTFRNCREGVRMLRYEYPSPSASQSNRSFLRRSIFTVNEDYPGIYDFQHHVYMNRVVGIPITGCTFENLVSDGFAGSESHRLGHGIVSLDASYTVQPHCNVIVAYGTPCTDETPSRFTGLDHGISARNAGTTRNFRVSHTQFENNICGVYANGVAGYQVKDSHFTLGNRNVALTGTVDIEFDDRHRGIFSTESWAFAVDDNALEIDPNATAPAEGIVIGYCREHNDVVFRNQATGLERGYIGEGICADLQDGYTAVRGLWFLCNSNTNNVENFLARKVTNAPVSQQLEHTIRLNQGIPDRPADNTFDLYPWQDPTYFDFKITTTHAPVQYWHRGGTFVPTNYSVHPWGLAPTLAPSSPANNCANKVILTIPYDPAYPSGMSPGPVIDYLLQEKLAYGNVRYLYEQAIDAGNTDAVVQEIQSTWPQNAWDLYTYMMDLSPNLSPDALMELVLRDVLPDAMLTEILVANPNATRTQWFLPWLQQQSGYPLPEYMVNMIMASWNEQTYPDLLEDQMAFHHGEMTQAANLLIHHYQTWSLDEADSIASVPMDSVRWVWRQLRTPAARYAEAFTWLQELAFDSAAAVVELIAEEHRLSDPEMAEQQRMLGFIAFLQDLHGASRTEMELDSTEVLYLQGLIEDAYDRPAAVISNLLCFGYGICRPPLTGGDGAEPKSLVFTPKPTMSGNEQPVLKIHPNPASTWVALDADLRTPPVDAFLVVRDITGREVFRTLLNQQQQQIVWDTRHIAPGTYAVVLVNGRQQVRTEKLVVRP
ncbi:MAG: T9SS type A sorting domain-containing protein [Flavobacteriales bacterium]|nr:T9SS type A sorting domain-containing protein [Flavobacteriales bacterium]